ncbi:MAG: hypothetical protein ABEJ67_05175 [Halanaeroarchaeum sp.]
MNANQDDTTHLFGAAIALVSGSYSLLAATGGGMLTTNSGILMSLVGIVVVLHGAVLLTPVSDRLGTASGPLMIGYSLLMGLNQLVVAATMSADWGMGGGMATEMGSSMGVGASWDIGMVALAVLMFISGAIMTRRPSPTM